MNSVSVVWNSAGIVRTFVDGQLIDAPAGLAAALLDASAESDRAGAKLGSAIRAVERWAGDEAKRRREADAGG